MTEDTQRVNGSEPAEEHDEDQPLPGEENPRADYQRAVQRLQSILRRAAKETDTVDVLQTQQDVAIRSCELSAMQTLLIRAGICTAADIYREAAIAAVNRGNTLLAQLERRPRIVTPGGN